MKADSLRTQLLSAKIAEVPEILKDIEPHRSRVDPLLRTAIKSETDPNRQLLLSLGLVRSDRAQVPILMERMLKAPPEEFALIRDVLEPDKNELIKRLCDELAA